MTLMFLVQQITSKVYFLSYSSDEKVACKRILEKKGLSGFQVTWTKQIHSSYLMFVQYKVKPWKAINDLPKEKT
jgi:hypothetical protein